MRRNCHRATLVFLALVVTVFVLINLPGQIAVSPDVFSDGKYGPHFGLADHCEHGWPFVYMRREAVMLSNPPYWRLSHWDVFEGVERFNTLFLILDVLIGLAIALAAAFLFETWRRHRKRLLQFYVRDMLILAGVVSVVAAVFVFHRSQHAAEKGILQAIDNTDDPNIQWSGPISDRVEWQPGGPSWLRQLVGDRPFTLFDRVVGIDTSGIELKHVVKLRHVKVVRVAHVSNRQLQMLEDLPYIEALDMCYANLDDEGQDLVDEDGYVMEQYFRLPRLPKLRGLNLYETAFRGDGLRNIPSIETLELTGTDVDDDSIPALSTLNNLRELSLYGTSISDSGIVHLRTALPDCRILR